ncbi:MAG TPA: acetolactate synthase large subunit, partial [Jatrophihabitantaceae bacterium]
AASDPPGRVANLILPAALSWSDGAEPAPPRPPSGLHAVPDDAVSAAVAALRSGEPAVLLLGDGALRESGLVAAARVAASTGARVITEVFPARMQRGAGLPAVPRLAYPVDVAHQQLAGTKHLILASALAPVSFFGYPGVASELTPPDCHIHVLSEPGQDVVAALEHVADEMGAPEGPRAPAATPSRPTGPLTADTFAAAVAATLPEGAIVSDESATSGFRLGDAMVGAPRHDVLALTGGAIGQGLPVAVGAAVACPDRRVLALEADGSAMYTISALWTMAREQLNTTVVILDNGAYAILRIELQRVGADVGSRAAEELFDLTRPRIDFAALGTSLGVPSTRAVTADELTAQLERSFAEPGPHLIHAVLAPRA